MTENVAEAPAGGEDFLFFLLKMWTQYEEYEENLIYLQFH